PLPSLRTAGPRSGLTEPGSNPRTGTASVRKPASSPVHQQATLHEGAEPEKALLGFGRRASSALVTAGSPENRQPNAHAVSAYTTMLTANFVLSSARKRLLRQS